MYIYVYLAIICIHISLCSCPVPVVYRAFRFSTLPPQISVPFFPLCLSFRPVFFPSRKDIPFVITEDESRVIGTRSFRVTIPLPPSPIHPSRFTTGIAFRFSFRTSLLKYA